MNQKLKIALKHDSNHQSEQGFALPLAVGMGMIMLLVGMTMVMRSQEDQITASAQKATADSLGVTETGITRVQALLKKFPVLAAKDASTTNWTEVKAEVAAPDSCGSGGGNGTIPVVTAEDLALINAAAAGSWLKVDSADLSRGEFRVLNYTVAGNVATLSVEGRARSENGAATTLRGNSTASLTVQMPAVSKSSAASGLWATNFSISGDTNRIRANVMDTSSSSPPASDVLKPVPPNTYSNSYLGYLPSPPCPLNTIPTVTVSPQPFPSLPAAGASAPTGTSVNKISAIQETSGYPTNTDKYTGPSTAPVYTYALGQGGNSISLSGGKTLTLGSTIVERVARGITGYETIVLYLPGGISTSGSASITLRSGTKAIFYIQEGAVNGSGGSFMHNGDPENLQIYQYGTGQVSLSGSSTINGFIFAPLATAVVSGSAIFKGAIWAKSWSSSGSSGIIQGITNPSALKVSAPVTNSASINPIDSWRRREAQ